MVMTRGPLCELVPIENAAMPDRTMIAWDKYDLDELGILKVDCLGLGMLTAIRKCFDLITQPPQLTLASIPSNDRATYDMICRADTIGVFQIESRAQMSMLPRLQPRCYYDLVIEVAIVRPGPIQGQMVHPYLRRRGGLEPVSYVNDAIRQVLEKTLGVPLFQEQAMQLAVVAAGFTPGEADQLRRAMGAWRKTGSMDPFRLKLIEGMKQHGLSEEFAHQVFQQIRGFGEYGFPESHAASFALLVYVSAWLKCHHPACFLAAMLNSQPLGFYSPAQLVRDARNHGVTVLPVDVNHSDWDNSLERVQDRIAVRLGLRQVVGLSQRYADMIVNGRLSGNRTSTTYRTVADFAQRTRLPEPEMVRLAKAGAFGSLGKNRRQMLWDALAQNTNQLDQPLFAHLPAEDDDPVCLPELDPMESVMTDYLTTGLSLQAHPISFYRRQLARRGILSAVQLDQKKHDMLVIVAGLVILRQRPSTAKGITFVTLEDETGTVNLVVRQSIWDRYYSVARRSAAWIVHGRLQRKHHVTHVVASRLTDFGGKGLGCQTSRDFR
jgi:error-prone DNA polymerase